MSGNPYDSMGDWQNGSEGDGSWDEAVEQAKQAASASAPSRGKRRMSRRLRFLVAVAVVALVAAGGVFAWFSSHGSGTASAGVGSLGGPAPVAATSPSTGVAHVTWTAVTSPSGVASDLTYTVQRSTDGSTWGAVSSGGSNTCNGSLAQATVACDDYPPATGDYYYRVTAVFRSWTSNAQTASSVHVVTDVTPPTTAISFPVSGFYNASQYNAGCVPAGVCGTASDASGVAVVRVSIRQGASGPYWDGTGFNSVSEVFNNASLLSPNSTSTNWNYGLALPADGSYTVHVQAEDTVGNDSAPSYTSTGSFSIDTTGPSIAREVVADSTANTTGFITQGGSYYAYAQVSDAGSGVASVSADVSNLTTGATSVAMSSSGGPWTIGAQSYNYRSTAQTAKASLPESGNPYGFTINASDVAANPSSASSTVTVDNTAPVTTDNAAAGYTKNSVTVTLTPSDGSGSGVAQTYYTTDGSTPTTSSSSGTSISLTSDGVYTIKYFSVDNLGNTEAVKTAANQVKIDKTNPTAPLVVPTGATYTSGGGTVYIANGVSLTDAATDPTVNGASSGVASVQYLECAGTSCTPSTSIGSASSGTNYPVAWNSQPADGSYRIAAKVTDNVGNTATSSPITVVIDNTPPSTTDNTGTIGNGWKNTNQTVTLSPSDGGSGVANTYYTTGSPTAATPTTSSSQGTSVALSGDGLWQVKYFSKDNLANTETVKTAGTQIRIDETSPTPAAIGFSGAFVNGGTTYIKNGQTLTDAASDPTVNGASSGVASVHYYYCAGTCTPTVGTNEIGSGSTTGPNYSVSWTSQPADGVYSVLAHVTDTAGNSANSSVFQVTIDNTKPTDSLSLATNPTGAFLANVSGLKLFYKGNAVGNFKLIDTVGDGGSGPASATFPAIGTTGWTHNAETVTTPGGGPYTSTTFSWTASPTNPSAYTVTSADGIGNASTGTGVSFVSDTTAPTGGSLTPSLTANGGNYYSKTGTYTITRADYTETQSTTQSGLASSVLTRQTGTWNSSSATCGSLGSLVTVTGNVSETNLGEACYVYTLTGTDNVGNTATTTVTVDVDKTAPAQPASVALANGGGQGNSYINIANKSSVSVTVTGLENISTDTVNVTISDGTHTATGNAAVTGTSVTVTGINASTLNDGTSNITISATETDAAGNTSSSRSAASTYNKDTIAPSVTAIASANKSGGTAGQAEQGDSITLTFSETLLASSIPSTSNVVLSTQSGNSKPVSLDLSGLDSGPFQIGTTPAYLAKSSADVDFNASAVTEPAGNQVKVTLGTQSGTGTTTVGSSQSVTFPVATGLTDLAGNPATGSFTTTILFF